MRLFRSTFAEARFLRAASLHVEAVLPNFIIHEMHEGGMKEDMRATCKYDYIPKNGFFEIPDLPGIGQELSEQAMAEATVYTIDKPRTLGMV